MLNSYGPVCGTRWSCFEWLNSRFVRFDLGPDLTWLREGWEKEQLPEQKALEHRPMEVRRQVFTLCDTWAAKRLQFFCKWLLRQRCSVPANRLSAAWGHAGLSMMAVIKTQHQNSSLIRTWMTNIDCTSICLSNRSLILASPHLSIGRCHGNQGDREETAASVRSVGWSENGGAGWPRSTF